MRNGITCPSCTLAICKRLENDNSRRTQITAGIGAGVIGVGGSALLASLVLALDAVKPIAI